MGSLDDPILRSFHDQINEAINWSSRPDWQKVCAVLNGMAMPDMLDEIWRIKGTGRLDGLSYFVPQAEGVNIPRLRAAIGSQQDDPPGDFDALLRSLPPDQRFAIMSVRAANQAPDSLAPNLWPKYYWSTRSLPAPNSGAGNSGQAEGAGGGGSDDDAAHLAADIATALTANAPKGSNPATYTVTVVYRNLDAFKHKSQTSDTEVAVGHEPNISVQISPDPHNSAAYQAAITLINVHIKRNWGLIKPDVEISFGAQVGVTNPGAVVGGGVQAQIELHVTTKISVIATSSMGFGPKQQPGDPPDYGSYHDGNVSFTPLMIGIIGHWDPP
jgi:hypothetical protein